MTLDKAEGYLGLIRELFVVRLSGGIWTEVDLGSSTSIMLPVYLTEAS